ncbi:MAG: hypothetical protein GY756_07550 [bacterium]|nr:hypothetical protein [bacterium]
MKKVTLFCLVLSFLFSMLLVGCNSGKYETAKNLKFTGTNSYGYFENYDYKDLKATRFHFGIQKMNYYFKYFNGNNAICTFQIEQPTEFTMNFLSDIKRGNIRFSVINLSDTFMSIAPENGKETQKIFILKKPGMYFLLVEGENASGKYSLSWTTK